MNGRLRPLLACLLPLLALSPHLRGEVWTLANGDRITGTLIEDDGETLEIRHAQLGILKLPISALKAAPAEEPTGADTLEAATKTAVRGRTPPPWKRQIEVGFSQQSGTNSKEDLSIRVLVEGRQGKNTYRANARVLQSEANERTVTDRREADFRWRHDLSKRLFAQALTTYAADDVRQVDLSLEQQIGGGYRVLDQPRHRANVGLGAVVQYLDREDIEPATGLLGSFFQDYTFNWSNRLRVTQEANMLISDGNTFSSQGGRSGLINVPRDGSYRLRFNTAVQSKVTTQVSVNLRYEYDYDRSVADPDLRGDQRITTSLAYLW